jgi:cytochrome c oxidase subunit 2
VLHLPRRIALVAVVVGSLAAGAGLAACGDDGGSGDDVVLSAAGERGKELARTQGCISCHSADGSRSTGPTWKGIAGAEVELENGSTVVRDDAYLRTAIIASRGQVVKGYANIMPVYEGELSEEEIADLIAYLRDLAPPEA